MKWLMAILAIVLFLVGFPMLLGAVSLGHDSGIIAALLILCWSAILFVGAVICERLDKQNDQFRRANPRLDIDIESIRKRTL